MEAPRPRWSSRTKLTIVLLLLAFGVFLLYRFSEVLTPLILAIILAYILSPITKWFVERLRINRSLATFMAYLVLVVVIAVIPLIIIPPLAAQSTELNLDMQRILAEGEAQIAQLLGYRYEIAGWTIDVTAAIDQAIISIQGLIEPVVGQTLGFAFEVITSLVWVVFILVISFYLVKDSPSIHAWLEDITPPSYKEDYIRLRDEINLIWGSFFRGQLVLAAIVATIFTVIGLIICMPLPWRWV